MFPGIESSSLCDVRSSIALICCFFFVHSGWKSTPTCQQKSLHPANHKEFVQLQFRRHPALLAIVPPLQLLGNALATPLVLPLHYSKTWTWMPCSKPSKSLKRRAAGTEVLELGNTEWVKLLKREGQSICITAIE